jgi:broad specificity phosphatase PhoE
VTRARIAATCVTAVALGAVTSCVGPSRTDDDYERKAANTAEAISSSLGTVQLGAENVLRRNVFGPYLSRLVAEAEDDAQSAQQAFDSVQPPSDRADEVHDHLDQLVQDALDLLRDARVAARRGDLAHVAGLRDALRKTADELDAFEADPK